MSTDSFKLFGRVIPLLPVIVASAMFMENIDSTVIATSLPAIAQDLHEDPIALKLALTSYLVSLAIFIPVSGWMADRFGTRKIFMWAIGVFMGGSLLCACSDSLMGFVAARFAQGMGGAMMVPVGRLIVLRSTTKTELVKAMNYLTIPALLGPVIGPPLGGFISTYFHWRWIFFINIPITFLGLYMAWRFVPQLCSPTPPLDKRGFALSAVGLVLLMMGFSTFGRHLVSGPISLSAMVLGGALIWLYVMHARACTSPLLNLGLFKNVCFRAGVAGGFLFRAGIGATPFLLPLMMQLGFGLTPFQSGALTCASAIGAIGMKTLTTRILRRYGFRQVLLVNSFLVAASLGLIASFTTQTSHLLMVGILLFGGCLRSLQFTSMGSLSYADIERPQMSQATSLSSVAQQLAAGVGITVGATALQLAAGIHGHAELQAIDFSMAFLCVSIAPMASILFLRQLPPDAGAEVSGHTGWQDSQKTS